MPNIGAVNFPGIRGYVRWSMTLSHGVTPSVCMIDCVPQGVNPPAVGTLQFTYDRTRITFPDCLVDSARMHRDTQGNIVGVTILDKRWRWRYGNISGFYNRRKKNGAIDKATEKSPQDLAKLLFQAMNEPRYDVSGMPNEMRPECDWDFANAAQELAELCDDLGCRIALGIDGVAKIHKVGAGRPLPNLPSQVNQDFGYDPPFVPDEIVVVTGPVRFQTKFKLEAVGEDVDGSIKPIDQLSYKPSGGWKSDGFMGRFFNLNANLADRYLQHARQLADSTVYRWYRIVGSSKDGNGPNDQYDFPIGVVRRDPFTGEQDGKIQLTRESFLPRENGLVQTYIDSDEAERPRPAVLSGLFWNNALDAQNLTTEQRVEASWSLDQERGIVMLSEPVYKLPKANDPLGDVAKPDLYLTVAHGVIDDITLQPVRRLASKSTRKKPLGTGPYVIVRDDISPVEIFAPMNNAQVKAGAAGLAKVLAVPQNENTPPSIRNPNEKEDQRQTDYYIAAAAREFEIEQTADLTYAGLIPISPDGAIQQVSWSSNEGGCFTRASLNTEHSHVVPTYRERRASERLGNAKKNAAKAVAGMKRRFQAKVK